MDKGKYSLPKLPYGYGNLKPYISEEQLTIHHQKHHQAYVNGANAIFDKLDKARADGGDIDMKSTLKELSFNIGGHLLHSLFWANLMPPGEAKERPGGALAEAIDKEFGSFDRFKKEFTKAAAGVEGSGWAALALSDIGRLVIMQIEKHNTNVYPAFKILLVVDVFEHAYYIDYKNDRGKFLESFWKLINWDEVGRRFKEG